MAYDLRNAHFREMSTILHGMAVGVRLLGPGIVDLARTSPTASSWPTSPTAFDTALAKPDGFVKATVVIDRAGG